MINARESGLKTEQMEISLDDDAKQEIDEKKTSSQAKGMVLEVSKNRNTTSETNHFMKIKSEINIDTFWSALIFTPNVKNVHSN